MKVCGGTCNPARPLNIPNNKMPQTLTESMWGWAKNERMKRTNIWLNDWTNKWLKECVERIN